MTKNIKTVGNQFNVWNIDYINTLPGLNSAKFVTASVAGSSGEQFIYAKYLNPSDSLLVQGFVVDTPTQTPKMNLDNPIVTNLSGGGFVVTWVDEDAGAPGTGTAAIMSQLYDGKGSNVGGNVIVNTGLVYRFSGAPDITGLEDGGFVVTWEGIGSGSSFDAYDVKSRIYGPSGVAGPEFTVNTTIAGIQEAPKISGLANGGFVEVWHERNVYTAGEHVKAQIFDSEGNKVGNEFLVSRPGALGNQGNHSVAGLAHGGFVISFYDEGVGVVTQIYDQNGARIGNKIVINSNYHLTNSLLALANGDFVVGSTDGHLPPVLKIYNSSGELLTEINNAATEHLTSLDDHSFVGQDRNGGMQVFSISTVSGPVLEHFTGTDGSDIFSVPDRAGWTISGLSGNDMLAGGSAADTINGGDGSDCLSGGASNDILRGQKGKDVLYGGEGNDLIVGGGGQDSLYGGTGADTFRFLLASDSQATATGRDTIFDFSHFEGDRIDLHQIDANTKLSGNQDFVFAGTAFTKHAGEVIQAKVGADIVVRGDVNGDGVADFAILLKDLATPLVAGDFLL